MSPTVRDAPWMPQPDGLSMHLVRAMSRPVISQDEALRYGTRFTYKRVQAVLVSYYMAPEVIENFGRPVWWVTVTHMAGKRPAIRSTLSLMQRVALRTSALEVLRGAGLEDRQRTFATMAGVHVHRPVTNAELGAADLRRMPGELHDPCASCGRLFKVALVDGRCPECTT